MRHALKPFPGTPPHSAALLTVDVTRTPAGIDVHYALSGQIDALKIPATLPPERRDNLWHHTCFELFVKPDGGTWYREFNLSPSTCWAVYDFTDFRKGVTNPPIAVPPRIKATTSDSLLELHASITWPDAPKGPWTLAVSTVVEEQAGGKYYWALAHPAGKADFHNPASFVLPLQEP
jgi:hypothetical protein